jgi:5-formaminoimidazole-4-carboxamide-1-(beta)-D-ribofuranosyl 5'-monophosphate synthetase
MNYKIATFGSHSALQILKGAKQEGFETICICKKGTEKPYQSFKVADQILLVDSFDDFFSIEQELIKKNAILIPHASMIAHFGIEKINKIKMPYFGDKAILQVEADRAQQASWLASAELTIPKTFAQPSDIDRLSIVKFYGAEGGNGYFLAASKDEFNSKISAKNLKQYQIQEYVIGVPTYIHYFYSPLTDELELFGFDRRYESNVDGIGRIAAHDQAQCKLSTSYTVAGNTPLVVRESLLPEVFAMGESVVRESKKLTKQGLYGAFCLETIVTSDLKFYVFEISARIVAGTNVSVDGSPYSALRYDEPMSTGRRIAREIKMAIQQNRLHEIIG